MNQIDIATKVYPFTQNWATKNQIVFQLPLGQSIVITLEEKIEEDTTKEVFTKINSISTKTYSISGELSTYFGTLIPIKGTLTTVITQELLFYTIENSLTLAVLQDHLPPETTLHIASSGQVSLPSFEVFCEKGLLEWKHDGTAEVIFPNKALINLTPEDIILY